MQKWFWWALFFGAFTVTLVFYPERNFSNRVRDLFHTLQDTAVAWLDKAPENEWQIVGVLLPLILTVLAMFGYLRAKSDRWQELFIKAFVPLLTATLALFGSLILDVSAWMK